MATTQELLDSLKRDKQNLVSMLNNMEVEASNNETFTSLIPKVGKIVSDPILQDKSITITENGTTNVVADSGYNGLNNVEVIADIPSKEPTLQDKTIEITENGTQTITADEGYNGLNNVSVTTNVAGSGGEMTYIKDCYYLFNDTHRNNELETLLPLCTKATTYEKMFYLSKLKTITGFANFKNDNVVSTINMFGGCNAVTSIDFGPNTRIKSNNISNMFNGCYKLTSIDLSGLSHHGGTSMASMFTGGYLLKKINLSHLDLSNITTTASAFANCYVLEELDISNMNLTKLTSFGSMFNNCGKNLTSPTKVYVKDQASKDWILNSSNGKPTTWTTENIIIKG
jgi:hypothetical protein